MIPAATGAEACPLPASAGTCPVRRISSGRQAPARRGLPRICPTLHVPVSALPMLPGPELDLQQKFSTYL